MQFASQSMPFDDESVPFGVERERNGFHLPRVGVSFGELRGVKSCWSGDQQRRRGGSEWRGQLSTQGYAGDLTKTKMTIGVLFILRTLVGQATNKGAASLGRVKRAGVISLIFAFLALSI